LCYLMHELYLSFLESKGLLFHLLDFQSELRQLHLEIIFGTIINWFLVPI
jgi:hypothetical protein